MEDDPEYRRQVIADMEKGREQVKSKNGAYSF